MKHICLFFILIVGFSGCRIHDPDQGRTKVNLPKDNDTLSGENEFMAHFDTLQKGLPIFYNMYLSVDMSTIFRPGEYGFEEEFVNPLWKKKKYLTTYQKAMNLGVYAVDLSYIRSFNELDLTRQYLEAMQELAVELGIPGEYFLNSAERYERNMLDKDSIYKIANEVYFKSEKFLNEKNRDNASVLIVMAGWTEALFLGTKILEKTPDDMVLLEMLNEQRYSLKLLLDLMRKFDTDKRINEYIQKLKDLENAYHAYNPDFNNVEKALREFEQLRRNIHEIRKKIVN